METNDVRSGAQALTPTRGSFFLLLLMAITALAFVGLRYRLHKKEESKPPALVQTKRHVYVRPSNDQPEIPIVYAQSL